MVQIKLNLNYKTNIIELKIKFSCIFNKIYGYNSTKIRVSYKGERDN